MATTLGSAAALALVAVYTQTDWWPWRITVTAVLVTLLVAYFLWSRRGDIYDEIQAQREVQGEKEETGG